MQDLKVTLIQANLHWEQPTANMAMFEEMLSQNDEDTDLIVLPEMFTTGFSMKPQKLAEPPFTNTFKWMHQIAKSNKALVVGSYIIRDEFKHYNRMYAVFPDGTSHHYDKKHLFSLAGEHNSYSAGKSRIVVEWKNWKICPLICYDLRFPELARNRYIEDAFEYDLLIYSANWPKPRVEAWDALLKARAIENQAYTIGVNRVGQDGDGYEYVGHSGIYDHAGAQLAFETQKEAVINLTLEKGNMDTFRDEYAFLKDADLN